MNTTTANERTIAAFCYTRTVSDKLRKSRFATDADIEIKGAYGPDDARGDATPAGTFPFTRGVQPTMYRGQLWTMRQYAGFGTAAESNRRYKYLLAQGGKGLSVAFDLPTQMGRDSDHAMARGEVGRVGVAIDSLEDMRVLFDGIPLADVSTSMTINATAATLLALYIAVGEEQGASRQAAARHDPERHPQGVHRARHVHLSARRLDAAHHRHVHVLQPRRAAVEHGVDQRLPHPRGRLRRGAGGRVHARRRHRLRRGGAKLDFKRDQAGALHLLEINPRFTLWHHPAAVAGVNIPALVYADLTGTPRPATTPAKAGVRWCRAWKDLPAARASGVPLTTWLPWVVSCEAKSTLSWNDPMPVVRSTLYRLLPGNGGQKPEQPARVERSVRLALISDIHANLEALEATFYDIAERSIDRIVCLGDIVGYNSDAAACIALIRGADCVCVAGNHDLAVCGRITTRKFSSAAARAVAWTRAAIERRRSRISGKPAAQGQYRQQGHCRARRAASRDRLRERAARQRQAADAKFRGADDPSVRRAHLRLRTHPSRRRL